MKKKVIALILIIAVCYNYNQAQVKIHTIGDSTMEEKSTDSTANPNGQRGWAQMLTAFVMNGATVNDRAKSGTSSKTFYEGVDAYGNKRFWATVIPQIKAGDYVFIQFGHNDEKDGGWQSDHDGTTYTGIGTNPWEQYTRYLTLYVNEVRALGAIPILMTPIVRNGWTGTSISAASAHNIGIDSIGRPIDYPAAMKKVASDMGCAIVDHTALTKAVCEQYGQAKVTSLIYNVGDGTHLGEYGATLYARLAVQDLIRQGILTNYLNANPDLLLSAKSYNFGKCYANTSNIYSISVSGVDLVPALGNITVTAPAGFTVSVQQSGTYSQSVQLAYTLGSLNVTNIYVKYNPTVVGKNSGNLAFTYGGNTKNVALTGECVSFAGGQKANVYWELSKDVSYVADGAFSVIPETFSNMTTSSYAVPGSTTTWADGKITTNPKTQRNVITGNVWPAGEIDIVNDRFIQFGVKAVKGTTFNVDSIGLYAGGAGGSGMRFRVYFSKDSLFSETTTIADRNVANTSNTMYPISYSTIIEVKSEESLYVRVYPWYNSTSATGKTICLYGVTIKGVITTDNPNPPKSSTNIIWNQPGAIAYGTALSAQQLNATTDGNASTAIYSPTIGTLLPVGTNTLSVTFDADANYEASTKTVSIVVNKAPSSITWENPQPITHGTALSAIQLNATVAGTSGAAVYSPPIGTLLPVGIDTLSVEFSSDTNFEAVRKTVTIEIKLANTITPLIDNEILIYPNPANGFVNITLPYSHKDGMLTVLSANGAAIFIRKLEGTTSKINLNNLSSGTYIFQISLSGETFSKLIIKK